MEHPNVKTVREAAEATAKGDMMKVYESMHPDVVWTNDLAAGPWSGTVKGRDNVMGMFAEFIQFFEGNFHQEVHDIIGGDEHVVELLYERGTKDGHVFDNRAVYVLHVTDGKITEAWTLDLDRNAAQAFWKAVGK
jgi:ketosteroid isomerase-like protein